ncbi:B3 domain-containing transcription factor VRN1-like [Corylus avellana]|uniref:B3 domain-containing transcription factor VRN1-like n=1 Tax=Corylus avellana TaxID=13451 RepID=UPI00286B1020|nr:B3 domain-containing transcription factor VRN1-like [Corylus avellana]
MDRKSITKHTGFYPWTVDRYERQQHPLKSANRTFFLTMAGNRSRTRRTPVVPNRSYDLRLSTSMGGRKPSHFFNIILPSTVHENKLMIPVKFVMEFGDELSDVATLTVPNGHFWQVGLEKGNNEIWFDDGWKEFMEYHSIDYGYFLVFRYEGNSKFHVLVLDCTATEIEYPLSKDCNKNVTSSRERAIQAAKMLKPASPSFMSILRPYQIEKATLYVPVGFAIEHLTGDDQFVKLQTTDGKQWDSWCYCHTVSSKAKNIGWAQFCRDNDLAAGDVCVFELIKMNPVVLNVSIFRLADY